MAQNYRELLNEKVQRIRKKLDYEWSNPIQHNGRHEWKAKVLSEQFFEFYNEDVVDDNSVNGIEYGFGRGSSLGEAKEAAAQGAYNLLCQEYP
ncbi:hypothetical protein CPC08DRAFT_768262 [Agrocybe pediades]|nr:hypothetical protein CPC08DRAFT_768262 [Agrocybe pediades]